MMAIRRKPKPQKPSPIMICGTVVPADRFIRLPPQPIPCGPSATPGERDDRELLRELGLNVRG